MITKFNFTRFTMREKSGAFSPPPHGGNAFSVPPPRDLAPPNHRHISKHHWNKFNNLFQLGRSDLEKLLPHIKTGGTESLPPR